MKRVQNVSQDHACTTNSDNKIHPNTWNPQAGYNEVKGIENQEQQRINIKLPIKDT